MKATRQMVSLCLVIGMLFSGYVSAYAQTVAKTNSYFAALPQKIIKSDVNVGDKVPDIQFTLLNSPLTLTRLSDFSGKLVILDFWATWCSSCLKNLPKLDSLQQIFRNQVQIILVNSKNTGDDFRKVQSFLKNWKARYKNFNLPSAVMDTTADRYFAHKLLPHYVWIGPDGILKGITSGDQITYDNIKAMIESGYIKLPLKKDVNVERPLFLSNDIEINELTQYSIFIKGRLQGLPSGNKLRKNGTLIRGIAMMNAPILSMYKLAVNLQRTEFGLNDKRLLIELRDSSNLLIENKKLAKQQLENNTCTFELIVPVAEAYNLYNHLLEELNRYSGFKGRIENRKVKCLALIPLGNLEKLKTIGGNPENKLYEKNEKYLKNEPLKYLINFLDNAYDISEPIIDETNYNGNIDINFPLDVEKYSFDSLAIFLKQYNLKLLPVERELKMFVISKKDSTNSHELNMH